MCVEECFPISEDVETVCQQSWGYDKSKPCVFVSSQRENILITFGMLIMKKIVASNVLKIIVKNALLKCIVRKNHC